MQKYLYCQIFLLLLQSTSTSINNMYPFILSQLPVLVFFVLLIIELYKKRRYELLVLALLFLLSVMHTFFASAYLVVYSEDWKQLYDYAVFASCLNTCVVCYILHRLKRMIVGERTEVTEVVEVVEQPAPVVETPPNPEPTQKEMTINNLKNLIENERIYLRAGLRIDEVAVILGTNRTYIAKMMKEVYGCSFTEYMNQCRLKSAQKDMLTRKNASIETIALANGFNSSNTFNKVFNQHFGCAPAAWRREALDK